METLAMEKGLLPGGLSYVRLGDKPHSVVIFPGLADATWDVTSGSGISLRNTGGSPNVHGLHRQSQTRYAPRIHDPGHGRRLCEGL